MAVDRGIFSDSSDLEDRFIADYDVLAEQVNALKKLGYKVVLTSGSFDLMHRGHLRYLIQARKHGDVLIVGLDSDEKIHARKGEGRPLVQEDERLEMLAGMRPAGIVTLKNAGDARWQLIDLVKPDVLIVTVDTYDEATIAELEDGHCGKVVALPRMAEESTTNRIRLLHFGLADKLTKAVIEKLLELVPDAVKDTVNREVGRSDTADS